MLELHSCTGHPVEQEVMNRAHRKHVGREQHPSKATPASAIPEPADQNGISDIPLQQTASTNTAAAQNIGSFGQTPFTATCWQSSAPEYHILELPRHMSTLQKQKRLNNARKTHFWHNFFSSTTQSKEKSVTFKGFMAQLLQKPVCFPAPL